LTSPETSGVAVVVIGRNEGDRIARALVSVLNQTRRVVYVDSGSTDRSVELAASLDAVVLELDGSAPFTAARARDEGFKKTLSLYPETEYVQFLDGDCELAENWLAVAQGIVGTQPDVAVVCGRLRERRPEQSPYNRLCDIEWDAPLGDTTASGGIAMMRVLAFQQVDGHNQRLIAGEDEDICARLRNRGWRVVRINAEMATHDAHMTRFRQWWRRAVRSGYACIEVTSLHGGGPMRHWTRMRNSILFWGLILPLVTVAAAWLAGPWGLLPLVGYPLLAARIVLNKRSQGLPTRHAALYAASCVGGKFPQLLGMASYWFHRLLRRTPRLIEYKNGDSPSSGDA